MSETAVRDAFSRPLRDLRISVIDRCNFRCPYCMPKDTYGDDYQFLPPADYLSFAEVTRLVRLFVAHGVTKVRLTGGEPLLRPGLAELIAALTRIPGIEDLALTTNGFLLAKHAAALRAAGLRRVTVSLDSVDPEVFARMNGLGIPIDRVLAASPARRRWGWRRSSSMRSSSAASTITRCWIWCAASPASRWRSASSNTWTWATATAGIRPAWCRAPS